MNFRGIDPNLYVPLWKLLRDEYVRGAPWKPNAPPCRDPGYRA
jgi:hypothetical protein